MAHRTDPRDSALAERLERIESVLDSIVDVTYRDSSPELRKRVWNILFDCPRVLSRAAPQLLRAVSLRSAFYALGRFLGDVNAVKRGGGAPARTPGSRALDRKAARPAVPVGAAFGAIAR